MNDHVVTAVTPGVEPALYLLEQGPAGTITGCEAQRRNRQALHALEVDWGNGVFDYGKIRALLAGLSREECPGGHWIPEARPNAVANAVA